MMKLLPTLLILLSIITMTGIACKKAAPEEVKAEEPAPPPVPKYPSLSNQDISLLYSKADKVDIIFYKLPISVNQEDLASVRNTVLYVTPASPNITATCQAIARLSWMAEGTIMQEADVYCDAGCEYLLFMKNNQPFASNALAPEGVAFFKNIIAQVEKVKSGQ